MDCHKVLFSFTDPAKDSIVGSDERLPRAFQDDASARGAHSGIDNHDMNSAREKLLINGKQIESGSPDILWRNFVCDINDAGGGINGEDRALQSANEIILRAEVGQESNDGHHSVPPQRHEATKLVSHFSFVSSCLGG